MIKLLLTIGDVVTNEFLLVKPEVTLGRSDDNDIVLDDPLVSGCHARIVLNERSGSLSLQDLNSTNGTRVNGQEIRKISLRQGDTIQMGRCVLLVHDDRTCSPTQSQK